jgi:hypothetical protein
MNAFEATLLAYYTLRLPACPGYEKAAKFEGLMNFDNHIAAIHSRATRLVGSQDTLDLFDTAWTLGIIDWRRASGYATGPDLGSKIIDFLESLPKQNSGVVIPFVTAQKLIKEVAFAGHTPEQIIADIQPKYKNLAMEVAIQGFLGLPRIGE